MNARAYYNEIDAYAAQWLRNLIDRGLIAPGDVDERDIRDVRADDVRGYTQCHWFAGIGGWSYALRLAGWDDDRPVWTGSCPCQPFSAAGKGKAADDERHLWPAWLPLIRECCPPTVFGEQVEAAIAWGWLDAVFTDLEAEGYACGASVLPACGVGAPHIRQRTWFVADAQRRAAERRRHDMAATGSRAQGEARQRKRLRDDARPSGEPNGLAYRSGAAGELGQPDRSRSSAGHTATAANGHRHPVIAAGWDACDWLPCTDGKARPVEPGSFPLAHGIPGRVGRLRAYGNAIVPILASEFIGAYLDMQASGIARVSPPA